MILFCIYTDFFVVVTSVAICFWLLSFQLGGINGETSEGPLPALFSPSLVIQFRGPLEFIVPVYGLAEQSATWLSGQTLSEPEKEGKGRLTRGQGSFAR